MFNIVSLLIGLVSLVLVAIAFLPILGALNWLILPLPIIGAGIGQLSGGSRSGRNLCLIVLAIGVVRLMLGGGIL
ncbi:hypothetical protein M8312_12420 [Sphingomonas sp. KRR8]|uniref:hypothetical protein n=1 Tax=Sphingomonas sp. KRR8 TaxID=2942996 RepID=UPI002021A862|nr:hypothetical protein [Sphingomonas sp. KRR8]URD60574.1 hypothetical protein M8312_12420 [Sphingomonas sp. KRR8]